MVGHSSRWYPRRAFQADLFNTACTDIKAPASSSEVKKDVDDFTDTIRTLARLVYDQVNILKTEAVDGATPLGGELILLLRDLLADAAEEVSHLADEAASELRPKEGEEGKIPSKEDVKQKGKEVQDKAQKEGEKGKERLNKEAGPVQDKAQEAKDKAIDRLIQVSGPACIASHAPTDPLFPLLCRSPTGSRRTTHTRRHLSSSSRWLASTTRRRERPSRLRPSRQRSTATCTAMSTPTRLSMPSSSFFRTLRMVAPPTTSSPRQRRSLRTSRWAPCYLCLADSR